MYSWMEDTYSLVNIKSKFKHAIYVAFTLVLLILLWEYIIPFLNIPEYIFPRFSSIVLASVEYSGELGRHAYVTLTESLTGFALAAVAGTSIALMMAWSDTLFAILQAYLVALNSFPKSAIAPIFVVWFGLGFISKLMMAFVISIFPIIINTYVGLREVEPNMLDVVRVIGGTKLDVFLKIRAPHSLIYIFTGFKTALPLAMVGAIVGEFVGSNEGLGYFLLLQSSILNTSLVFGALFSAAILSIGMYYSIVFIDKQLIKWRPSERVH